MEVLPNPVRLNTSGKRISRFFDLEEEFFDLSIEHHFEFVRENSENSEYCSYNCLGNFKFSKINGAFFYEKDPLKYQQVNNNLLKYNKI